MRYRADIVETSNAAGGLKVDVRERLSKFGVERRVGTGQCTVLGNISSQYVPEAGRFEGSDQIVH